MARLPLALRIAAERASRYPQHTLGELIQDLRDESGLWELLATGDDESSRVRSVFAWSYQALPADAASLFRLLGLRSCADFCTNAAERQPPDREASPARRRRTPSGEMQRPDVVDADRWRWSGTAGPRAAVGPVSALGREELAGFVGGEGFGEATPDR
ncbi:hypothetical protein [Micromonospora maris]|uniref:hypothetical protein n=1 Tax=Micromonospora maris TaxID=1003110 RepID=UPI000AF575ED|nr:hypothetical protein [Micromonospora maris]